MTGQNRPWTNVIYILEGFTVCALIVQALGFLAPAWYHYKLEMGTGYYVIYAGLWFVIQVVNSPTADVLKVKSVFDPELKDLFHVNESFKDILLDQQIECSIAIFFAFVAVVMSFHVKTKGQSGSTYAAILVPCFLSAVASFIAIGFVANEQIKDSKEFPDCVKVPYAMVAFGIGGLLLALTLPVALIGYTSSQNKIGTAA